MCKNKNCMGGYDDCGCKCRTTDNCITLTKDLTNINSLKGEALSATLAKIDGKIKVITVNKALPAPKFLDIVNDYTINISLTTPTKVGFFRNA